MRKVRGSEKMKESGLGSLMWREQLSVVSHLCKLSSGCPFMSFIPFEEHSIQFMTMFTVSDFSSFSIRL